MERDSLVRLLDEGVSVERIAQQFGKHPSTISYWMAQYGLVAPNRDKHAAKGAIAREQLVELLDANASIATMAQALQRSPTTVRHWLDKYGLETQRSARLKAGRAAKEAGVDVIELVCRHHGKTAFAVEGRGTFRCLLCRRASVLKRRRKIKSILVQEAGAPARCVVTTAVSGPCISTTGIRRTRRLASAASVSPARSAARGPKRANACCCARTAMPRSSTEPAVFRTGVPVKYLTSLPTTRIRSSDLHQSGVAQSGRAFGC